MRHLKVPVLLALIGVGLAGCAVYPAAEVAYARPGVAYVGPGPVVVAGERWVPGHFGPWGAWHRGHWAP